jgi:hypothetical protein
MRAAAERTSATPPSPDRLLRAHRRYLHRRNAAVGAGLVAAGIGTWGAFDGIAATGASDGDAVGVRPADGASATPHGAANPACTRAVGGNADVQPSPSASPPATSDPTQGATAPAQRSDPVHQPTEGTSAGAGELARVSLPNPAPGFPVRRAPDSTAKTSDAGVYLSRTFLVAATPGTTSTPAPGVTETRPNGQEATVIVACHGAFPTTPDAITARHEYTVIGTTTARGQTATVVRSDTHQIGVLLTYDGLDIAAYGDYSSVPTRPVTPTQLDTLINALEHLDG